MSVAVDEFVSLRWPAPFVRLDRFDAKADLAWDQENVYLLSKDDSGKSRFQQVFSCEFKGDQPPVDAILRARSDGKHVWIATIKEGISVFSQDGTRLAGISVEDGLPRYKMENWTILPRQKIFTNDPSDPKVRFEHSSKRAGVFWHEFGPGIRDTNRSQRLSSHNLSLLPLGDGRCLAYGRFGEAHATWIAMLTWDGKSDRFGMETLYEADRAIPPLLEKPLEEMEPAKSLLFAFDIPWVQIWSDPDTPEERVAIVGRMCSWKHPNAAVNAPLAVDLQTNKVSLLSERIPGLADLGSAVNAVCAGGSVLLTDDNGITGFIREAPGKFAKKRLVTTPQSRFLVLVGDSVYSPGRRWYRIDLTDDVNVVDLGGGTFPIDDELNRFASSANYGLFAGWDEGPGVFRMDPDKPCKRTVTPFENYVPKGRLAKHVEAVAAIRKLGGDVRRVEDQRLKRTGFPTPYRTGVSIPKDWKGGDEGLRHLKDLHDIASLYLANDAITNEGMKHLADVEKLTKLYLVETAVTTEGLKHLDLRHLEILHLEGHVGGNEFGNETLELFDDDCRLGSLCLYGPQFDEGAVKSLKKMKWLWKLRLLDTGIPLSVENSLSDREMPPPENGRRSYRSPLRVEIE